MQEENIRGLFHDLKNDLASMTSILNLHKLYKDSITNEDLLNRIFERQTVISTGYERLYRDNDYPNIGLNMFLNELLSREGRTLNTYCTAVQVRKEVADIRLPVKKATALGQVLVELLTNSYRHAFVPGTADRIIEFHITESDGSLKFDYMDNGKGLEEELDPFKSRTLGMQFMVSLSKQLGGVPLFNRLNENGGLRFQLEFGV